jgi:hypothetical protein
MDDLGCCQGSPLKTINPKNAFLSKGGCDTGICGRAPVTFGGTLQHDFATT